MITYTVKAYVESKETGQMVMSDEPFQLKAEDVDTAREKVKAALTARGYPPGRAISFAPGAVILAYCRWIERQSVGAPGVRR